MGCTCSRGGKVNMMSGCEDIISMVKHFKSRALIIGALPAAKIVELEAGRTGTLVIISITFQKEC
jgi:hypothetical protein